MFSTCTKTQLLDTQVSEDRTVMYMRVLRRNKIELVIFSTLNPLLSAPSQISPSL